MPLGLLSLNVTSIQPYVVGIVGFTLMFHLVATFRDAHPRQSDLKQHGLLFSYAMIVLLNLICTGLVLTLAFSGTGAATDFLARGVELFYVDGLVWLRRIGGF